MTPEMIGTIFEGVRLFLYVAVLVGGAVLAIYRKIDSVAKSLKEDFEDKHKENRIRVDALQVLVIRHDTILSPEYNGHFMSHGKN